MEKSPESSSRTSKEHPLEDEHITAEPAPLAANAANITNWEAGLIGWDSPKDEANPLYGYK